MNYAIKVILAELEHQRSLSKTYEYIIYHPNNGLDSEQMRSIRHELMILEKRIEDIEIALPMLRGLRYGEKKLKHLKTAA